MENVSDIYFYLGYVIIFSLLGLFALFMHVPHSLQLGGYRKSRILLGSAFIMMAVYCTTCLLMPKHQNEYFNFWLLAVVSLIFSWLNYTSFLFLIDASYKVRRSFIIDGVIPTMLMFILGNDMSSSNTAGAQSLASNINSQKKQDIQEKIKPNVERWVTEKRYCTSDLSIKDVAAQIGTNHTYLSFYLNNTLNMTFQVWLNTLRIEESKHILATENITIEEVGIKVGIPQSYNFSRWFKIVTGTTPFRYRKEENRCRQTIS